MTQGYPGWFAPLLDVVEHAQAHQLSVFAPPVDRSPRRSAVLILFGEGPHGPDVLLTERAAHLRSHAGQVAFPGGALDPDDAGPVAAALREAREETGVDPSGIQVAGALPDLYLLVSDFVVTPVIAWWRAPSPVGRADPAEVAGVTRVPVAELVDPANRFRVIHPSGYVGPGFAASGLFVWGFTAGLLDRLLALTGWERPWDATRSRPLPRTVSGPAAADPAATEPAATEPAATDPTATEPAATEPAATDSARHPSVAPSSQEIHP